jgi:hypothetical protein
MISAAFVLWILAGASLHKTKAAAIASLLPQESVNRQDEWLVKQGAQAPCSLFAFVITLIALSNLSLVV